MPAYSLRYPIVGRGCARTDLATMALCPKTAEQTPQARLSHLLLHLVQPLPHSGKLLHLRLVVFLSEPPVSLMVHSLGPLREGLSHVRAPSKALPDRLRPAKSTVHRVLSLALVNQVVAMTAQEVAPRSVQDGHPPTASGSGTDKPRPLPSEVAGRPSKFYRLPDILPFAARPSSVTVEQGNLIRQVANTHYALDGARLLTGPRPAQ